MSQANILVGDGTGAEVITNTNSYLNLALAAIASGFSGPSAPSNPTVGMTWIDTSVSPIVPKIYTATGWVNWASILNVQVPFTESYQGDTTDTVALPSMNVVTGDRIMVTAEIGCSWSTLPTNPMGTIEKVSGSAQVLIIGQFYAMTQVAGSTQRGSTTAVVVVQNGGTLVLRSRYIYTGGSGPTLTNLIYSWFIKKT